MTLCFHIINSNNGIVEACFLEAPKNYIRETGHYETKIKLKKLNPNPEMFLR